MQKWQPPETESHVLKVTQLIGSGKQGRAARGRVANLSGVQAAASAGMRARPGLAVSGW